MLKITFKILKSTSDELIKKAMRYNKQNISYNSKPVLEYVIKNETVVSIKCISNSLNGLFFKQLIHT